MYGVRLNRLPEMLGDKNFINNARRIVAVVYASL